MATEQPAAPPPPGKPVVLAIDIGGSHVKIMVSSGGEERKAVSGLDMTAAKMIAAVQEMAKDLTYDVVAMGFPGPVAHDKILAEPHNLGSGWVGFDFAGAFGKPLRIVNDALMQAVGSYDGGRMLFLGLGTGLGAAMIVDNVAQPMELAHLPYKKGHSFEDYVVLGGGNVEKLDELPENVRRGDNANAFKGGFRIWQDPTLRL